MPTIGMEQVKWTSFERISIPGVMIIIVAKTALSVATISVYTVLGSENLMKDRMQYFENSTVQMTQTQRPANHPRDGEIAIYEEFELLLARNTIAAMELFIARHPGHSLAKDAASQIEKYKRNALKD